MHHKSTKGLYKVFTRDEKAHVTQNDFNTNRKWKVRSQGIILIYIRTYKLIYDYMIYDIKIIKLIIEGSLEVKLPTIWTVEKQRWEESEEKESEERRCRCAKRGKVAKHCVFPMICGSGGSKSRLAKAAGAEPAGQMRDENLHAVVARSTFWSQNVQNTPCSDHFWRLRCQKSARRCGAKHISKSKCTKHTMLGPLLEVEMSKKCTPLWREAHFQVKMYKTPGVRTTFGSSDVEKSARRCCAKHISKSKCTKHQGFGPLLEVQMSKKCTPLWREAHFEVKMCKAHHARTTFGSWDVEKVHAVVARSTFRSQKCKKLRVLSLFWRYDVEKVDTD